MLYYFNENSNRGRGRPTTTLPITLNNDLKRLQNKDVQLTTKEDLHKLQKIASQRQEWIAFTAEKRGQPKLRGRMTKLAEGTKSSKSPLFIYCSC
ncbi:hypothetical protein ElyMa_004171600 [Elysia marginata]|uniref:Uncharacterized protein n=1 Tax=Elysia marginata TaxID=1093978 RepID=A0AAV4GJ54_9GAST|nr:hypothetical protein ElyMa_004171600 [Elysia marginata]